MAYIPVPLTCQAELIYSWDGQVCENVLHYEADAVFGPSDMVALGEELITWWDTNIQPNMPTNLTLFDVRLTDMTADIAPLTNATAGLPLTGVSASPSLPNSCALVLTKRTILRGRSYRGRVYQPGLTEANVISNTVSGTFVAGLILAYNAICEITIGERVWHMVVVSRFSGGAPRVEGVTTWVDHFTSDGLVDSQRRRLPGRGG